MLNFFVALLSYSVSDLQIGVVLHTAVPVKVGLSQTTEPSAVLEPLLATARSLMPACFSAIAVPACGSSAGFAPKDVFIPAEVLKWAGGQWQRSPFVAIVCCLGDNL